MQYIIQNLSWLTLLVVTTTYNSRLDTIVTIVVQLDVVQFKVEISHASLKLVVPDYSN